MQTARTTVELDKALLRQAKQRAIEEDKTLKEIIHEALERLVDIDADKRYAAKRRRVKRYPFRAYNLGEIKGTLSREEIYDWL